MSYTRPTEELDVIVPLPSWRCPDLYRFTSSVHPDKVSAFPLQGSQISPQSSERMASRQY